MKSDTKSLYNYHKRYGQSGFTIVEILVAVFLISFAMFIVTGPANNSSKLVQSTLDEFDRAIRFAKDEAVLRNSIIRLKIELDKQPNEYILEYANDTNAKMINYDKFGDEKKLSFRKLEKRDEEIKKFSRGFTKISEFSKGARTFDKKIKILGVTTSIRTSLLIDGEASLFFYPSGEQDSGLIIISSGEEIASMEIEPFSDNINFSYHLLEDIEEEEVAQAEETLRDEIYFKWLK